MYENNLKQHVRNHHTMTREFIKKYKHGQFHKEILFEKITNIRLQERNSVLGTIDD